MYDITKKTPILKKPSKLGVNLDFSSIELEEGDTLDHDVVLPRQVNVHPENNTLPNSVLD